MTTDSVHSSAPAASSPCWPAPPLGALAAAIAATQLGRWSDAALLWRDLWRRNRPDFLAAACAAEAALRSGRLGLADHMLAQLPETPRYLEDLVAAAEPLRRARMKFYAATDGEHRDDPLDSAQRMIGLKLYRLALHRLADHDDASRASRLMSEALKGLGEDCAPITPADARPEIEAFFRSHPLARLADHEVARSVTDDTCPLPEAFETTRDKTPPERTLLAPARRGKIARKTFKRARKRLSTPDLSGAELARLIVSLERADLPEQHALMQEACHRLACLERSGQVTLLVLGWLYHELGLSAFARMLLRAALQDCSDQDERGQITRRLAEIVADRDELLEHARELRPEDFRDEQTRIAREALVAHFTNRHGEVVPVATEPLANAFDLLLSGYRPDVCYAPENRLLLVGSRLACGGTELLMANTYRHFSGSGDFDAVDMALLNFQVGAPSAYLASEAGLGRRDVVVLDPGDSADLPFSLLPGDSKARGQKLFDRIVTTRPRVVHAWDDPTGILAAFAALAAGCPRVVIHFHHCARAALSRPLDAVASYPAVFRRLVDLPQFEFAFCSKAAAEDYAAWWTIPLPPRFHTVYNGYRWTPSSLSKAEARRRIGIPETSPVIGTVIRFTPVKQPLLWAHAAARLAAKLPTAHFLMVGDGWLKDRVADELGAAGLRERVHLPGQVADVPSYLAAMDLFWLTSRTEGLSNVLIEAQRSGVPVLAFDCGGPRETFIDGETGILIPQDDTELLADRSEKLLRDHEWLAEAGRRGRENAERKFTAVGFLDGLKAIYDG